MGKCSVWYGSVDSLVGCLVSSLVVGPGSSYAVFSLLWYSSGFGVMILCASNSCGDATLALTNVALRAR